MNKTITPPWFDIENVFGCCLKGLAKRVGVAAVLWKVYENYLKHRIDR